MKTHIQIIDFFGYDEFSRICGVTKQHAYGFKKRGIPKEYYRSIIAALKIRKKKMTYNALLLMHNGQDEV